MKFICNREEFSESLGNVSRAVSSKSSTPAMEGVLIRSTMRGLSLCCYNLEMGIMTEIESKVIEEGEIVLSAKLLSDMVKRLASDTVEIECDSSNTATIKGGKAEYKIIGYPAEEFPTLPEMDGRDVINIKQDVLKNMIDQTIFAVAQNEFKPVHTGSKFTFEGGMLTLVSVDGFRLAIRKEPVDYKDDFSFVVPGKTLSEVAKLCGEENDAELRVALHHIVFRIGEYVVFSRLLEGEFLDFRSSIPTTAVTELYVNVRETVSSIERTALLISDRLKSPIKFSVNNNEIHICCATPLGKVNDTVACESKGDSIEMGFNNRYLLEALRASGCDKVKMEIAGPLSPVKIIPIEGDSFLFLVLPVRIKTDI